MGQELILTIQKKITQLDDFKSQLDTYESDILKNYSEIVLKMEVEPFKEIIKVYDKKIQKIESLISDPGNENAVSTVTSANKPVFPQQSPKLQSGINIAFDQSFHSKY